MAYSKIDTSYPAKSISYGNTRSASAIKYIVVHYTSNKTDKAVNNAKYYANTNTREAGAHYFVDETSVYQSIDDLKVAWSVGGSRYTNYATTGGASMYGKITNANSISIEMCSTNSKITDATMENVAILTKSLMTKYNIPASNIYRHFDVTGKSCPNSTYTSSWSSSDAWIGKNPTQWNKLKSLIGATTTTTTSNTNASLVYRLYAGGKWTAETKDGATCGTDGKSVTAFMFKLSDGSAIKYRAHKKGGGWYGWVTGYNGSDSDNGYAGDGRNAIDAIEIKCDKYDIRYKVSDTTSTSFMSEVKDSVVSGSSSYAGYLGRPIDKMSAWINK